MNTSTFYRYLGFVACSMVAGALVVIAVIIASPVNTGRCVRFDWLEVVIGAGAVGAAFGLGSGLVLSWVGIVVPLRQSFTRVLPAGMLAGLVVSAVNPLWGLVAAVVVQAVIAALNIESKSGSQAERLCLWCGYDVKGLAALVCPECGKATMTDRGVPTRKCPICADPTMDDAGRCSLCGVVDERMYKAAAKAREEAARRGDRETA